jgi:hypothetical protein
VYNPLYNVNQSDIAWLSRGKTGDPQWLDERNKNSTMEVHIGAFDSTTASKTIKAVSLLENYLHQELVLYNSFYICFCMRRDFFNCFCSTQSKD